ncbi:hypothetical protein PhCBS80983_g00547 [Powellomyces hirtus]|uniref:Ubiquitin carboxyl-terminal hydrolase n=1 Tax=Powellomyces hirtus TaxID=109895 RepID=A0A507EEY3_9FUNG|nr:hypothetical protein PhCBS80983_g00547 [Powellomyces hirtus]
MSACSHLSSTRLSPATPASEVYKEECTLCFDSQDMPEGIDVCLSCFNGGCAGSERHHAQLHYDKTNHPIVLNIKRIAKARKNDGSPPPAKITKLAIEVESEEDMFDFITEAKCYGCGGVEIDRTFGNLPAVIDSVMSALSAKRQSEVKAWHEEITSCSHTENVSQSNPHKVEALSHCSNCDVKDNLWLCLTCGNLGCGRQQFGGIGGNGHGLNHFEETRHPVSVKIGTITPEGGGDVFCYQCGEDRVNPRLAEHLASFGINIATQQKTQKSLGELQLEQNLKFDFSMTTEDGKSLDPLFGPGLTGLKNLGNSCYMASVLQAVFALRPFQDRYLSVAKEHMAGCRDKPSSCFHCQMGKMADGLLSGRYSQPPQASGDDEQVRGQDGIAPSMFKSLVGKGHAEFSTMRQQDAQEFFQHLITMIEQKERAGGADPSEIFKFDVEQRLQCLECNRVRYRTEKNTSLTLRVPANPIDGQSDGEKPAYHPVAFNDCLGTVFNDDIREYKCPHDNKTVSAKYTTRVSTFPDTLLCTMSRFVLGAGWVMEKLNVSIPAPLELDLERFRGHGQQEGEEALPEDSDSAGSGAPQVDALALDQLMGMGFPEIRCAKALLATGNNGAEIAMAWLFEHMDDPDIDAPIRASAAGSGAGGASEGDIQQLTDMGFTAAQAERALKETSNNMERAVDWLFSHADSMEVSESSAADDRPSQPDNRPAKYQLVAFISHKGTSTHCGHYVAHILKDGQWVLFNDNKVVHVPDIAKAVGEAYIYVYSRIA